MRKILFTLILTIFFLNISAFAYSKGVINFSVRQIISENPFGEIDAYLAKNNQDFDNSGEIVRLFNKERNRLGTNFEKELWKYLGKSLPKHYWISIFLENEEYLQGNDPLPQLAFNIREKGVELPAAKDDYQLLGMKYTMLRKTAVDLFLDGKQDSAKNYKKKADNFYEEIKDYGVIGADDEYVICVFDNLEKDISVCKKEAAQNSGEDMMNTSSFDSGSTNVLNGEALSLPKPEYPKAASAVGAAGAVNVKVVVNEQGNIVSAEAVSGHLLLRSAAIEAAKKAKFRPFTENGKIIEKTGIIVYNFSKK
jgi:TonB family protein